MTRAQIITRFREENPEITPNVCSDITLNSWCLVGDKEICAKARLIVNSSSINAVEDQSAYDLTSLNKFFDIDEIPGGGVTRVTSTTEKRLVKLSKSQLDDQVSSWRTAESGTPRFYYRRGKYMYVYPKPDGNIDQFNLDFICISDDFNNDNITPYNQLSYLEPYHPGIIFYLTWRAKAKVGKQDEATNAMNIYNAYVEWMKREIGGGKYGPIEFRPSGLPSSGVYR